MRSATSCSSAERERERLNTGIEELDLELAIGDRSRLSNQLVQADGVVVANMRLCLCIERDGVRPRRPVFERGLRRLFSQRPEARPNLF